MGCEDVLQVVAALLFQLAQEITSYLAAGAG